MGRHPIQIALLAGAALAGLVRAQTQPEGPVIVGERREMWKMFQLQRLDAAFEFLGQYRYDRLKDSSGNRQLERETLFRELLDINTEAYIGHKNLIDLTAVAQLGLDNRSIHSDAAGTEKETDFVDLYDVRALVLGNGPAPTTVYTRREQNIMDRGFASRIDQTTTESGIITQIQTESSLSSLQYFHREQELSDPFEQLNSSTVQDTFNAQSGIRLSSNQKLDLSYNYDHIQDDQPGFFNDTRDRNEGNITHTITFGPEALKHELRSWLRLFDESGQFAQRDVRLEEQLALHHSERLETHYNFTFDQQEREGETQRLYRGEASIRHRLFESLTSSASAGAQRLEATDQSTTDDLFASGLLDYTKLVPLGRMNASAGVDYDAQQNSARGTTIGVLNEPHVYNAPFPIILGRRNIVVTSIVVTPVAGFPVFLEGIDYTVRAFPDRVELSIPLGSAIQDGQTVIVNYDVGPEPESEIDTFGTTLTFRYTLTEGPLQGLSPFVSYRTTDHQLDTADPSLFVLDDIRDLVLGVDYTRAGFDLRAEHERRESTVDPYDSDRFRGSYTRSLGRGSSVIFEASHDSIRHKEQGGRVDFDRVLGKWIQRVSQSLDFNVRLEYRNERDSESGNSEGFEQTVGFNWRKAQTTIYGSVQNSFLNGSGSERTTQLFQLGIKRAF